MEAVIYILWTLNSTFSNPPPLSIGWLGDLGIQPAMEKMSVEGSQLAIHRTDFTWGFGFIRLSVLTLKMILFSKQNRKLQLYVGSQSTLRLLMVYKMNIFRKNILASY